MKFVNYPTPVQAAARKNAWPEANNPVLRGGLLKLGASLVSSSGFLQQLFWSNAGFKLLRTLDGIESYDPRHDPTVVPLAGTGAEEITVDDGGSAKALLPDGEFWSARDYHHMYVNGAITPDAVVDMLLPLIQKGGQHAVAFVEVHEEEIRAAARASTERYQQGAPLSVLDGVPVGVKDEADVKGYKRMVGSITNNSRADVETSWCIQPWLESGAILMGKLNMHEYGLDTTNNNPNFGTPKNPFSEFYYTGGSSGGSGYCIGSGLMPITLGADGGGSIRIPATYCGAFGLKTSHGRVSGWPTPATAISTGVYGPICATMDDIAISYRLMAKPHPTIAPSNVFGMPKAGGLRRIGICKDWLARADPKTQMLFNDSITYLKNHDWEVVEIEIPFLKEGQLAHAITILGEISVKFVHGVSGLTPANKILVSVGNKTPTMDFMLAQKVRNLLMQHLAWLYQKYPGLLILTPTTPNIGWRISGAKDLVAGISDANMSLRSMEYVWMANFLGNPCLSVPLGYDDVKVHFQPAKAGDDVIPIGLMAMGEWGGEEDLIAFGKEWEEGWLKGRRVRPRDGRWVNVLEVAERRSMIKERDFATR